MKCLLCIHYDVVNFECSHLPDKLGLDGIAKIEPNWGCKEYESATSKAVLDKYDKNNN